MKLFKFIYLLIFIAFFGPIAVIWLIGFLFLPAAISEFSYSNTGIIILYLLAIFVGGYALACINKISFGVVFSNSKFGDFRAFEHIGVALGLILYFILFATLLSANGYLHEYLLASAPILIVLSLYTYLLKIKNFTSPKTP